MLDRKQKASYGNRCVLLRACREWQTRLHWCLILGLYYWDVSRESSSMWKAAESSKKSIKMQFKPTSICWHVRTLVHSLTFFATFTEQAARWSEQKVRSERYEHFSPNDTSLSGIKKSPESKAVTKFIYINYQCKGLRKNYSRETETYGGDIFERVHVKK